MPKFYGSFGCGQTFGATSVLIHADDIKAARAAMFQTFGDKFCTVYSDDYEKEPMFQKPVIELTAISYSYRDEPDVRCTGLFPDNIWSLRPLTSS